MARESFSDPELAALPQREFRRDQGRPRGASGCRRHFLAAASAFTRHLGWPLTVFATPDGNPVLRRHLLPAARGRRAAVVPDVLEAVRMPGRERRDDLEATGRILAEAIAARPEPREGGLAARTGSSRRPPSLSKYSRIPSSAASAATPSSRRPRAGLPRRACRGGRRSGGARSCDARWRSSRLRAARPGRGRGVPLRGASRLDRAALRADAERQRPAARLALRRRPCRRGQRRSPRASPPSCSACCGCPPGRSPRPRTARASSTARAARAATTRWTARRGRPSRRPRSTRRC